MSSINEKKNSIADKKKKSAKERYEDGDVILTLRQKINGVDTKVSVALDESKDYSNKTLQQLLDGFHESLRRRRAIK